MISSTSSTDRSARAQYIATTGKPAGRSKNERPDQISTENAAFLRAALARQPEVRPEVVARGRALAADRNYPSMETLRNVAAQILNSPDLSEDIS